MVLAGFAPRNREGKENSRSSGFSVLSDTVQMLSVKTRANTRGKAQIKWPLPTRPPLPTLLGGLSSSDSLEEVPANAVLKTNT